MFSRIRATIAINVLLALTVVYPAFAGGWAVITLDELPTDVTAGNPFIIGFKVLQHGRTPMTDLEPTVTARLSKGEPLTFFAAPDGNPGHYTVTLKFPEEGDWEWSIQAFTMDQKMPTISVTALGAATVSQPVARTEPSMTAISPLLIAGTLAIAVGLAGLVVAFRYKNRFTLGLTVICLLVGAGSFLAENNQTSKVEVQSSISSESLESSVSQVELGEQLFVAKGCITCHVNTKVANNHDYWTIEVGNATNLSNFSAHPDVLRMRLKDPTLVKSDTQMPNLDLSEIEIEALVAFINSK
jgi:hypothetical protein